MENVSFATFNVVYIHVYIQNLKISYTLYIYIYTSYFQISYTVYIYCIYSCIYSKIYIHFFVYMIYTKKDIPYIHIHTQGCWKYWFVNSICPWTSWTLKSIVNGPVKCVLVEFLVPNSVLLKKVFYFRQKIVYTVIRESRVT